VGRRAVFEARCPDPMHADSQVVSKGTRASSLGVRRRYRCTPKAGEPHSFSLIEGPVPMPVHSPAPPCAEHPGSKVVRNGFYGKSPAKKRQMYRCTPADGSRPHAFVPELARDHVHTGVDSCVACEELRGTHRGDRAVARRHSWSARLVAEALRDLAGGKSYAETSRDARRVTARTRTRKPPEKAAGSKRARVKYVGSALSANAWHTAADWVEAFAPVLWEDLEPRLRAEEAAARAGNDELLAAGKPMRHPVVLMLDDIPIQTAVRREYFVLVAALVQWVEVPGADLPGRQVRLRLVRGFASNDHHAWKLLLNEVGVRPDFVLADRGKGIVKAVTDLYGTAVPLLPSLLHLREAVEEALVDTPGARQPGARRRGGGSGASKELLPALSGHVRSLRRHSLAEMTTGDWTAWWDRLERLLTDRGLPLEKIRVMRRNYEQLVADLLPVYAAYPQLPVATGGMEVALRQRVEPVLAGRAHAFANLERVNRLFDLVVCRDWGVFDDTLAVADLIRRDNEAHHGWATPLRFVQDVRPTAGARYSSLRDQQLLRARAREAGLA